MSENGRFNTKLGSYQSMVADALREIEVDRIIPRIWEHDYKVWKQDPTEITNRLGWLHIIEPMRDDISRMQRLVEAVQKDGYTHALLLGMGGSSLAPEVFRKTFGVKQGFLDLDILDSTDPGAVLSRAEVLDLSKTLFIVSTKSGGTFEILSFFKYFYNLVVEIVGPRNAGEHFIAITDPGSKLVDIARQYVFRDLFLNDPNIGGRYSALSYFGLVPAMLVGVDIDVLLERALSAACECGNPDCSLDGDNPGARLGAIMGELAIAGRDKLTVITSPAVSSFGEWVEQLIAESTGKDGKGILPVVGEPIAEPALYSSDRLFVYLRIDGDDTHDEAVQELADAGFPVITIRLNDIYDLGGQLFTWEMATAVAGSRLVINPFDQPNVESAKVQARKMVAAFQEQDELPETSPAIIDGELSVYGDVTASSAGRAMEDFLAQAQPGAYVSIQAYIQPTLESDASLLALRTRILDYTHLATTASYGPRFLHSTGQLHKGDAGKGLFIQITAGTSQDVDIPDEVGSRKSSISFGVLKLAQALGDAQALQGAGRKVIRFQLGSDPNAGMQSLIKALT